MMLIIHQSTYDVANNLYGYAILKPFPTVRFRLVCYKIWIWLNIVITIQKDGY